MLDEVLGQNLESEERKESPLPITFHELQVGDEGQKCRVERGDLKEFLQASIA